MKRGREGRSLDGRRHEGGTSGAGVGVAVVGALLERVSDVPLAPQSSAGCGWGLIPRGCWDCLFWSSDH